MNKMIIASVAIAGLALAGCSPAAIGTSTGAIIGGTAVAAFGGNLQQVAIGAAIGGASGFIVQALVQAQGQPQGVCQVVNQYGQLLYLYPNGQVTTVNTGQPYLVSCN